MNPYGKQRSRNSNLARIYNFENRENGGLGPGFFIKKFITNNQNNPMNIIKKKYDLSIHIIHSSLFPNIGNDVINLLKSNVYDLNIQTYLLDVSRATDFNTFISKINSIITNIKSDENRCFLILDSTTAFYNHWENLDIPYYIYDKPFEKPNSVILNNTLLSNINSILFYKTEEKMK